MTWTYAGLGLVALGTVLAAGTAAEARDGCGPGFHSNPYGECRPNRPRFFGPPPRPRYDDGYDRRRFDGPPRPFRRDFY